MHFDAPGFAVDPGGVDELAQIKIRIKFTIDAGQQVEIKSRGHSQLVIVRLEQLCAGFFQIRSEKQRVSGLENAPNLRQEFYSGGTIEIPDRAPQTQHEEMLVALPGSCHLQQAIEILALKPHNADGINIAEFALAHRQR